MSTVALMLTSSVWLEVASPSLAVMMKLSLALLSSASIAASSGV